MAFRMNPPTIDLSEIVWDQTGDMEDPDARLLAHIKIGPLDMHLEAWEVRQSDAGEQLATEASYRVDDLDRLCTMMDTAFRTVIIAEREYVLVATPYGA